MKLLPVLPVLTCLAACGGSSAPPVTGPTYGPASGFTGASASQSYNPVTDEYTLNRTGLPSVTAAGDPTYDAGTFDAGNNGAGRGVFASETDSSSVALIVASGEDSPTTVRTRRIADTTIPASGNATLTGDYVAILSNNLTGAVDGIITGDASLTMDWDSLTTSGDITNRVLRDPSTNDILAGVSVADVELGTSRPFSDRGSFGGDTTGGSIDANIVTGAPTFLGTGFYNGRVAGATGDEAVGSVNMIHNIVGGGTNRYERGAYALGH